MIEIKNLTKRYSKFDKPVISNLNLVLPNRGIVTILGKSGSGKSTLLRLIGTMDTSYEGQIIIDGTDIGKCDSQDLSKLRFQDIGFAFQIDEFDYQATVKESLMWPLNIVELDLHKKDLLIESALKEVGLVDKLNSKIYELSGGERKRVGIARAILHSPKILIFDEPLASVDDNNKRILNSLFEKLARSSLVIIVTHVHTPLVNETLIKCQDGNFKVVQDNRDFVSKVKKNNVIRKKYSLIDAFKNSLRKARTHKVRVLLAISSLTIGLSSFGLTSYISTSVKDGVSQGVKGALKEGVMTIGYDERMMINDSKLGTDISLASSISQRFNEYSRGSGVYYIDNIEEKFYSRNDCYIKVDNRTLNIRSLSARNFINPLLTYEVDYSPKVTLKDYQIILALSENDYRALSNYLGYEVTEYLKYYQLYIYLDIANVEMQYENLVIFEVIEAFKSDKTNVVVDANDFNEKFVEQELKLEALNTIEIPPLKSWQIRKTSYLSFYKDKFLDFLEEFTRSDVYSNLLLEAAMEDYPLRMLLIANDEKGLDYHTITDIYDEFKDESVSYSFSNGLFGHLMDGKYNGFVKPLFLSKEREKLNSLADANYSSFSNLESFQSSSFEIPSGVYKCDLISSIKGDGVTFVGYSDYPLLMAGEYPLGTDQVIVSSRFAKELFGDINASLYENVEANILADTIRDGDKYRNIFKDITFKIVGIIENDESLAIYQRPLFPTAFMLMDIKAGCEFSKLEGGLIEFKDDVDKERVLNYLSKKYEDLNFSFPSEIIQEGIDEVINYIVVGLSLFASFTTIISLVLVMFVVLLFVKEDRKIIGLYLVQGFNNQEITRYYLVLVSLFGLVSLALSLITLAFSFITSSSSLKELYGVTSSFIDIKTIFLLVLIVFMVLSIVGLFVRHTLKKATPMNAL